MLVIGVDCANEPAKVGLARGEVSDGQICVDEVALGADVGGSEWPRRLVKWTRCANDALIAFDAPLGWPRAMTEALSGHHAGGVIQCQARDMFRRRTDQEVHRRFGGRPPLAVGADWIAWTAHSALRDLHTIREELRTRHQRELTLAWKPTEVNGIQVIEVYPAATLRTYSPSDSRYKAVLKDAKSGEKIPKDVVGQLLDRLVSVVRRHSGMNLALADSIRKRMLETDHIFDAVLCCVAAADFLRGNVYAPDGEEEVRIARKEGWIWVKRVSEP